MLFLFHLHIVMFMANFHEDITDYNLLTMSSEPPTAKPPLPRTKRPNYALLHANLLPLTIQALPPLIPHNPLSILQILYTYFFCRVPCQPEPLYTGVFNPTTRSVHVTDTRSIKAFWTSGFFGKGSLSRSEPTWISRRRRALGVIGKDEALTAEEVTERRRKERKEFKLERARAEKEKIQNQLAQEGKVQFETGAVAPSSENKSVTFAPPETPAEEKDQPAPQVVEVEDLEHLQLTLEEAFFLSYGLGALQIMNAEGNVCFLCHCHSNTHLTRIRRNPLKFPMPYRCSANSRTSLTLRTMPFFSQMMCSS